MIGLCMWLILGGAALAQQRECATELTRDMNCNGVDREDEEPVDLTDPLCKKYAEDYGITTADGYLDYASFGCRIPLVEFDTDRDGFSEGTIEVGPQGEPPDRILGLDCENCPDATLATPAPTTRSTRCTARSATNRAPAAARPRHGLRRAGCGSVSRAWA